MVYAARNEYESFQVVVSLATGAAAPIVIESVVLRIPTAPSVQTAFHREHYINITTLSNCEGAPGLWPDALIPDVDVFTNEKRNAFPATLMPPLPTTAADSGGGGGGANQAFWVDLFVPPAGVPAGDHAGTVTVSLRSPPQSVRDAATASLPTAFKVTLPIKLHVFGFALPSTSKFKTAYACDTGALVDGTFD